MTSNHQLVLEGRIVDLDRVYESRIGVDDGVITEISSDVKGDNILHLEKHLIFPGFIDTHVHLRVPGGEHKEDFSTGSMAALHGGVTTVIDMPNTQPPVTTSDMVRQKRERADKEGKVNIRFYALALPENLDSIPSLSEQVAGFKIFMGRSTGGFILPTEYLGESLKRIQTTSKIATVHCEDEEIMERDAENLKYRDYPEKHADVRSAEAEIKAVEALLSHNPDKVNIAHLSTAEALNLIKEYRKKRNGTIFCEITPHHLLLTRNDMRRLGNYGRMNPPLRTEEDRLAMIEGLRSGDITFLATDHAPHTREEKSGSNPPSGVPGLDTYGNVVAFLMREYGIPAGRIMSTTYLASLFFGLTDRGRIQVGKRADFTVLDHNGPVTISSDMLYTKCGWSPFEGMTFPGRAVYTVVNGRVYDSQTVKPVFTI